MVGTPTEQAVLIVNGQRFQDWETVLVRQAMMEQPAYRFKFTCSEFTPIGKGSNRIALQIKPGDDCQIILAGALAFTGRVSTRQVYYDKQRHYIEIQGANKSIDLSGMSMITKTMEMKNVDFEQIVRQALQGTGIKWVTEGTIPAIKFPRVSFMHGLSRFDNIDLYARYAGVQLTSNEKGDLVGHTDSQEIGDTLVEGQNILIGREIIYDAAMENSAPALSQETSNDTKWGAPNASVPFVSQEINQLAKRMMPFVIPSEIPTSDNQILKGRVKTQSDWQHESQITLFCTVYGWLMSSGRLWQRGWKYTVDSPMLITQDIDMPLKAKSVTFTQDSASGTRTTLELCNDMAYSGGAPPATP
jgi:prophage tail gpP-like protein